MNKEQFNKKAFEKHCGKYSYENLPENILVGDKLKIICHAHGMFEQSVRNHLYRGDGCPKCRYKNIYFYSREEQIERAFEKHSGKYSYENLPENIQAFDKVTIKCPVHGDFEQTWNNHIRGAGCRKCFFESASKKYSIEPKKQIERLLEVHSNKYSYENIPGVIHNNTKITIKCPVHGDFEQTFTNHFHKEQNCPKCRIGGKVQIELEEFFNSLGLIPEINNRTILKPQEIDFYFPELKIGIEYNGTFWHCSEKKSPKYHKLKKELAESKSINLIHIFEWEWEKSKDIIKNRLKNILSKDKTIFARKCIIQGVSKSDSKIFLNDNHIQGDCSDSIRYGLYYDNNLISLMTFGKPRFNNNYEWELIRYCSKNTVIGGASKLLKHFETLHTGSIISYANRNWTSKNNNLYLTLGFQEVSQTHPNYVWIFRDTILSRYQTQKNKLLKMFPDVDNNLSENEIMTLKGFFKVYDCGNLVFEKKK
jgi:hypothetical protein